mgnify:CR=1 FL=1|jgi:hypothetical protein
MRLPVGGIVTILWTQQKSGAEVSLHRTSATNNNHQAIPRKIITVKSLGVGEGIISPSSYFSHEASGDRGKR